MRQPPRYSRPRLQSMHPTVPILVPLPVIMCHAISQVERVGIETAPAGTSRRGSENKKGSWGSRARTRVTKISSITKCIPHAPLDHPTSQWALFPFPVILERHRLRVGFAGFMSGWSKRLSHAAMPVTTCTGVLDACSRCSSSHLLGFLTVHLLLTSRDPTSKRSLKKGSYMQRRKRRRQIFLHQLSLNPYPEPSSAHPNSQ